MIFRLPRHRLSQLRVGHLTGVRSFMRTGRKAVSAICNLFIQPISGGEPKKLTDFKSELIFNFDYSRDGKQIALSRGTETSDVLHYTNFK